MKNTLLCSFLIISINLTAQVPSYVPQDSLVGWWGFNGNANDESGNGNDGTINGAILTTDRFGNANSAYDFDPGDYIDCSQMPMLNAIPQLTLSVWVNADTTNGWRKYIAKGIPGSASDFGVQTALGDFGCRMRNGANTWGDTDTTDFNADTWYHVVMVFDGNESTNAEKLKIYVDGNQKSMTYQGTIPTITPSNNQSLYFGYLVGGTDSGHDGTLDEIGIWNRVLDTCEIKDLYNANSSCTNGINELDNSSVNLYPNPTNGSVTLSFSNTTNGQVILTDLLGKEVLSKSFTSNEVQLNLKSLEAKGTYFAKVLDADSNVIAIKKLIYQ